MHIASLHFAHKGKRWIADLQQSTPIGLPICHHGRLRCFHAPPVEFAPVRDGDFVGSIAKGGPINFFNVAINPHGNTTHTECLAHIADTSLTIADTFDRWLFMAYLCSIEPHTTADGDEVLKYSDFHAILHALSPTPEALIVRTLPNDEDKRQRDYSDTNPPYFDPEATAYFAQLGIAHLLTDLPSVDREYDGGKLLAHRAFWQYPHAPRYKASITELIYVPDSCPDGWYLLFLHPLLFHLDVSPSCPIICPLRPID